MTRVKRNLCRLRTASLIALALLLIATFPVFAYLYSAPLTITESGGTSYVGIGVNCTAPVVWLIDNGFITTATALDTRVETFGGTEQLHMMADDKIMVFVPSLPAHGQLNWYFTTGNSALVSFPVIVGYGGNVTIGDDDALELGNNFSIIFECWIPENANNTPLVYKEGAFSISVTDVGATANVTATVNATAVATVMSSGVSFGEHLVEVWADGVYLFIDVT